MVTIKVLQGQANMLYKAGPFYPGKWDGPICKTGYWECNQGLKAIAKLVRVQQVYKDTKMSRKLKLKHATNDTNTKLGRKLLPIWKRMGGLQTFMYI